MSNYDSDEDIPRKVFHDSVLPVPKELIVDEDSTSDVEVPTIPKKKVTVTKTAASSDGETVYCLVVEPDVTPTLINYLKSVATPTLMYKNGAIQAGGSSGGWVFKGDRFKTIQAGLLFRGYEMDVVEPKFLLPTSPLKHRRESKEWVVAPPKTVDPPEESSESEEEDIPEKSSPAGLSCPYAPAPTEPVKTASEHLRARKQPERLDPSDSDFTSAPTDSVQPRGVCSDPIQARKTKRCKKTMVSTGLPCTKFVHKYGMCSYHISQWRKNHVWESAAHAKPW